MKVKRVGAIAEREKMPFEVTPFMLYLTREANPNRAAAPRTPALDLRQMPSDN